MDRGSEHPWALLLENPGHAIKPSPPSPSSPPFTSPSKPPAGPMILHLLHLLHLLHHPPTQPSIGPAPSEVFLTLLALLALRLGVEEVIVVR